MLRPETLLNGIRSTVLFMRVARRMLFAPGPLKLGVRLPHSYEVVCGPLALLRPLMLYISTAGSPSCTAEVSGAYGKPTLVVGSRTSIVFICRRAVDPSATTLMTDVAKCEKRGESQNPVNHRSSERKRHPLVRQRICGVECRYKHLQPLPTLPSVLRVWSARLTVSPSGISNHGHGLTTYRRCSHKRKATETSHRLFTPGVKALSVDNDWPLCRPIVV